MITGVLSVILAVGLLPEISKGVFAEESGIRMYLNNFDVISEVPPYIENSRTMVPVRFVSEALGAKVDWDSTAGLVTVKGNDGTTIKLLIGDVNMSIEKPNTTNTTNTTNTVIMDVAAGIKDDRTFVPVRYIAEALGLKVAWDSSTRRVLFTNEDYQIHVLSDFPVGFNYVEAYQFTGDYGDGLSPREAALKALEAYLAFEIYYFEPGIQPAPEKPIDIKLMDYGAFYDIECYTFIFFSNGESVARYMVDLNGTRYEDAGRGYEIIDDNFYVKRSGFHNN